MAGIDIAHRNGRAERGAEAAARHRPDRVAGGFDDRGAFARRRAPVWANADAPALHALGKLPQYDSGAGEAALGAPPFADRPGEPGFDRRGRLVDIVAVEAE